MKSIFIILSFFLNICLSNGQVAVVVNENNPTDSISVDKLLEIYTLNTKSWDDGELITVVDLKSDEDSKKEFLEVLELSNTSLKKIRLKKLFTGKAKPPKALNSDSEIIEFISTNPGSVGYVDPKNLPPNSKVKVIAMLDI
jgi:ABC-type phosphate transport system substrate-binding protein